MPTLYRESILAGITIFILLLGMGSTIMPNFAMAQVDNGTNTTNSTTPTTPIPTTPTIITPLPPILENATGKNRTGFNSTIMMFPPRLGNATGENETAVGKQLSDFVHRAVQTFQQQRNETIAAIEACHASLANTTAANSSQIMDNCKTNLSAINDKYAAVRTKYNELFANFKSNMDVFLNETRGLQVDPNEKQQALDKIMNIRNDMRMEGKQDVLRGISNIMRGYAMMDLGHPLMGLAAIQKGKYQMAEANMTRGYLMHHFGNMTANYGMNPNGNMTGGYMRHQFGNMTGGYMRHQFGNMTGNYGTNNGNMNNGNMNNGNMNNGNMNNGNMNNGNMNHGFPMHPFMNMALKNLIRAKILHGGY
jgi:hypothetical protein